MGLSFADRTWVAKYRCGKEQILAYLSRRDSEEEARQTRSLFLAYAIELGNGHQLVETDGQELAVTNVGGSFDVMLDWGRLMMAVLGVEHEGTAVRAALAFGSGVDGWWQVRRAETNGHGPVGRSDLPEGRSKSRRTI